MADPRPISTKLEQQAQRPVAAMAALVGVPQQAGVRLQGPYGFWMLVPAAIGTLQWPLGGVIGFGTVSAICTAAYSVLVRRATQPLALGAGGGFLTVANGVASIGETSWWSGRKATRLVGQWPVRDVRLELAGAGRGHVNGTLTIPEADPIRLRVDTRADPASVSHLLQAAPVPPTEAVMSDEGANDSTPGLIGTAHPYRTPVLIGAVTTLAFRAVWIGLFVRSHPPAADLPDQVGSNARLTDSAAMQLATKISRLGAGRWRRASPGTSVAPRRGPSAPGSPS